MGGGTREQPCSEFPNFLSESQCVVSRHFRLFLQIQGSRESVHIIDFEGVSTSGPGDPVHGGRGDDGVEMVGIEPAQAQVEYHPHHHDPPSSSADFPLTPPAPPEEAEKEPLQPDSDACTGASATAAASSRTKVITSDSFDSMHSTDSDTNELQSLMPKHDKDSKVRCTSDNEDEIHGAT